MSSCKHYSNLPSVVNKPVFKDQCGRCYDNPRSDHGIDICLICLQAYCKSDIFDHSEKHRQVNQQHVIYLNIKETIVAEENDKVKEETEITKIAIGKPGGADFGEEKWEMQLTLRCYSCNVIIPNDINTNISNTIKYIANSSSESESSTLKAWELEIIPCEHTLTLHQNDVKILSKLEAHCNNSDCKLNSNLWLCLSCGNLGCGRKQYDGTGGNGHGIDHFKNKGHPLAVKTGTITPNGDACKY